MAQPPHGVLVDIGQAAVVIAALVTGWFTRGLKKMELNKQSLVSEAEQAAKIRIELDKALLDRIEQLDKRVHLLEVQHDSDLQTIKQLEVTAERNRLEIERLTADNVRLREQLRCPVGECPYTNLMQSKGKETKDG